MRWSDEHGSMLFGLIEQWSTKRKRIYSDVDLPTPPQGGRYDFVELASVGGTTFSPLSIVKLGGLLDEGVADSVASVAL